MNRSALSFLRPALPGLVAAAVIAALPATAQPMRARDGWETLRAVLHGAGLAVSVNRIETEGEGLMLRELTIRSAQHPQGAVLRMPSLAVQPRGEAGVALIPSWDTVLTIPGEAPVEARFRFVGEIGLAADTGRLRLAPALGVIETTLTLAAPASGGEALRMDLGLDDLRGGIDLGLGPRIDLRGALTASSLLFGQRLSRGDGPSPAILRRDDMTTGALVLEFALDRAELLGGEGAAAGLTEAFSGGFGLRMRVALRESHTVSHQSIEGMDLRIEARGGPSDSLFEMADGALSLEGDARDFRIRVEAGPYLADLDIDRMRSGFGLPMAPGEAPGRFGLVIELVGVQASEESWAAIGAAGLAGESADLAIDLAAEGRWLADPVAAEEPPLDLSAIRLDRLRLRFGETVLDGSGRFDIDPGATPAAPGGPPPGEGAFRFLLAGGERLLERLGTEGVLPADRQFIARMMLLGIGRPIDDDLLESAITIGRDGRVLVNGLPLPF